MHISRVPDENGASQACYIVEIHHSGREPSISVSHFLHNSLSSMHVQFTVESDARAFVRNECVSFFPEMVISTNCASEFLEIMTTKWMRDLATAGEHPESGAAGAEAAGDQDGHHQDHPAV